VSQPIHTIAGNLRDRLRGGHAPRLRGFVLALVAEILLVLVVLTLGQVDLPGKIADMALVSIDVRSAEDKPEPKPSDPAIDRQLPVQIALRPRAAAVVTPQPVASPAPPSVPPLIPLTRTQMAQLDITNLPRQPVKPGAARGPMGPPDTGVPGDTPRAGGAGPHGEKLYAAAWYREPYDDELAGYLSTASGPGWATIACRTVPDFRVDDCIGLDEYPSGSNIQRSVLAAAWQFQVRPPRLGGVSKVGEWVRIRITYDIRRN
jgi:periplasmic protein TonB